MINKMSEENIFQEKASRILRSLQLATSRQAEKTFEGQSQGVVVRISGRHEVESVSVSPKKYGLGKQEKQALEQAIAEAVSQAVEQSQLGASRSVSRALRAER